MKLIDKCLNRITMYRLVLYGLCIITVVSFLLAASHRLSLNPSQMASSLVLLLGSSYATEAVFAKIWRRPYNKESWLITALILFLIIRPPHTAGEAVVTVLAGSVANASKYILAWREKHIFNPAALAAAFLSLTTLQTTTWWVGNLSLWPLTLIFGTLVVRKIRRGALVVAFVIVSLALQLSLIIAAHQPLASGMKNALIASPLIFLSTIMLTEPATMPPRKNQQIIFAVLIAVLYTKAWKIGPLYLYPEVALLVGNIFAFVVAPKLRVKMRLKEIQKISDQVYDYVFLPQKRFQFKPGQYMEWTLPDVAFDGRGNRRTFTIASSPSENEVHLGVKFYNPSSAFKYKMSRLEAGDTIYASQLAGNFTLNGNEKRPLAFIAGGIGVTPFRSMVKYIVDANLQWDIILIYIVSRPEELAYKEVFAAAAPHGVKLVPVLSDKSLRVPGMVLAKLSRKLIQGAVPDYAQRLFYISGPDAMVTSAKELLSSLDIAAANIKTDHFSGY